MLHAVSHFGILSYPFYQLHITFARYLNNIAANFA